MQEVWYKAAMVGPPRICGVRLQPFSAWHALVLIAIDSPFALGARPVALRDLLLALAVCSSRWSADHARRLRALRALFRWDWLASLALAWLALRTRRDGLARAAGELCQYMSAYTDRPGYWAKEGGAMSRVPLPAHVVGTMLSHFGLSEARAWNMPLGLAFTYQAVHAEECGAELADEELDDARAAIAAFEAGEVARKAVA